MQYPIIDLITSAYINNGWTGLELEYSNNILPNELINGNYSGVTAVKNDDGSVYISGTADPVSYPPIITRTNSFPRWITDNAGKQVTVSSGLNNFTANGFGSLQLIFYGNPSFVISEQTGIIPADLSIYDAMAVVLFIRQGNTVDSLLYPHINIGTNIAYEPYAPPTTDIANRLKLPLPHYFPHPVIDSLKRASEGTMTNKDREILTHYLTPLGIGGI